MIFLTTCRAEIHHYLECFCWRWRQPQSLAHCNYLLRLPSAASRGLFALGPKVPIMWSNDNTLPTGVSFLKLLIIIWRTLSCSSIFSNSAYIVMNENTWYRNTYEQEMPLEQTKPMPALMVPVTVFYCPWEIKVLLRYKQNGNAIDCNVYLLLGHSFIKLHLQPDWRNNSLKLSYMLTAH